MTRLCMHPGCPSERGSLESYCPPHEEMHAEIESGRGVKLDDDPRKVRFDLVPPAALRAVASVLTYGGFKYGPGNWVNVPDGKVRYRAALLRHVEAWRGGEDRDPDTGELHLAHAGCCLFFLLALEASREVPGTGRAEPKWVTEMLAKKSNLAGGPGPSPSKARRR